MIIVRLNLKIIFRRNLMFFSDLDTNLRSYERSIIFTEVARLKVKKETKMVSSAINELTREYDSQKNC